MDYFKLVVLLVTSLWQWGAFSQWTQLGNGFGTIENSAGFDIAFHPESGEPYVVFEETEDFSFKAQRFNEVSWSQVGEGFGFPFPGATRITMAFHPETYELYVAYADGLLDRFVVRYFDGDSWLQLGEGLGVVMEASVIDIAFHPETFEPYVVYADADSAAFIVQRFVGDEWVQVGTTQGAAGNGTGPQIGFNPLTFTPYIVYPDSWESSVVVKSFEEEVWNQIGVIPGVVLGYVKMSMTFHPLSGEPYVSYNSTGGDAFVVAHYDGDSWSFVGGTSLGTIDKRMEIAFHPLTYELYAMYPIYWNDFRVERFDGTEWQMVDEILVGGFSGSAWESDLAFNPINAELHVIYPNADSGSFIVQKLTNAVGIDDVEQEQVLVYPNPTQSHFQIRLEKSFEEVHLTIRDPLGNQISEEYFYQVQEISSQIIGASGVYFLELDLGNDEKRHLSIIRD